MVETYQVVEIDFNHQEDDLRQDYIVHLVVHRGQLIEHVLIGLSILNHYEIINHRVFTLQIQLNLESVIVKALIVRVVLQVIVCELILYKNSTEKDTLLVI